MDIQAYIQSGKIESYVLGLASVEEVAEIEELRLQHAELEQAIDNFSVMLEKQALVSAVTPPSYMKEKIISELKDIKPERQAPIIPLSTNNTNKRSSEQAFRVGRSFRLWKMIAAAAIILLIASAALNIILFDRYKQKNEAYLALLTERNTLQASNKTYEARYHEWEAAKEMMADPAMAVIKMNGVEGKKNSMATIFWNTKNKDVFLMLNKLPTPEKGKQYQLWALVNGKPVDAGVLDPQCTGACKMKNIPKAQGFAITLEKEGGSPTPTLKAMYVLGSV